MLSRARAAPPPPWHRYRLVKAWANAHGLNDAASNTLNSWSLGLMVAFYLQVQLRARALRARWCGGVWRGVCKRACQPGVPLQPRCLPATPSTSHPVPAPHHTCVRHTHTHTCHTRHTV
jgi:hypothetical protein